MNSEDFEPTNSQMRNNLNKIVKNSRAFLLVVCVSCITLMACSSGISSSRVKKGVEIYLIDWSGGSYDNIHITSIDKVNEENDIITYKWKANFKFEGAKCSQSGFIYFYNNGDIEDFRVLNDLELR